MFVLMFPSARTNHTDSPRDKRGFVLAMARPACHVVRPG
jgi:hypothetical protein